MEQFARSIQEIKNNMASQASELKKELERIDESIKQKYSELTQKFASVGKRGSKLELAEKRASKVIRKIELQIDKDIDSPSNSQISPKQGTKTPQHLTRSHFFNQNHPRKA